jgi:DNA-binding NarL/FixJ family response regulator
LTELTAIAVTLSPIATDLVASLLTARAPMTLAARFGAREDAAAWLASHAADLVIADAAAASTQEITAALLALAANATVVVLSDAGRTATVSAVGVPQVTLVDVSAGGIAEAVLASIRQRASAKRR